MRKIMRTVIKRLIGQPIRKHKVNFASIESVKKGLMAAGYTNVEPSFMKSFKERVDVMGITRQPVDENNDSHEHANLVLAKMLNLGDPQFLMFDRDLSGDLLDRKDGVNLYQEIEGYLQTGKEIQIIIPAAGKEGSNENVISRLHELSKKYKLQLFEVSNESLKRIFKDDGKFVPFFAVSGVSYREETDFKLNDRRAKFSFNNVTTSARLTSLFSEIRNLSTPIFN
jgi:hypothetical protein